MTAPAIDGVAPLASTVTFPDPGAPAISIDLTVADSTRPASWTPTASLAIATLPIATSSADSSALASISPSADKSMAPPLPPPPAPVALPPPPFPPPPEPLVAPANRALSMRSACSRIAAPGTGRS